MVATGSESFWNSRRAYFELLENDGRPRLRAAQIGAAYSVVGHLSTNTSASIIAAPTGIGKTAIMLILPYLMVSRRVLVVVPSKLLREQLVDAFRTLDDLRQRGIISHPDSPTVHDIKHRMTAEEWHGVTADVVVSTPYCISPAIVGVDPPPRDFFDTILVDEAHHAAASTWSALLDAIGGRVALFTATPYRSDENPIPGVLVYDYSMADALKSNLILPLELRRVAFRDDPDVAIAAEVAKLVVTGEYAGVPFLARTNSVSHAKLLESLYQAQGLSVGLLLGEHTLQHAKRLIEAFRAGKMQGLIVVGVLGEGFNFPDIKLAAYHRPHKSIAPTLQFLGRIARKSTRTNVQPLVLVPEHFAEDETAELYRDNADWSKLIPQLADNAIRVERNARAEQAAFGSLDIGQIAETALTPSRVISVFEIPNGSVIDFSLHSLSQRMQDAILQRFERNAGKLDPFIAWISVELEPPRWARRSELLERTFSFRCVVHAVDHSVLIVLATSRNEAIEIAKACGLEAAVPVSPESLNGMLNGFGVTAFYNVGYRAVDAESELRPGYKTSSGHAVTNDSFLPGERENYSYGHGTARVKDQIGVVGTSSHGRVWTSSPAPSLPALIAWCSDIARRIRTQNATQASILGFRETQRITRYPENPIAAALDPNMYSLLITATVNDTPLNLYDLDFIPIRTGNDACRISVRYQDQELATMTLGLDGAAAWDGPLELRSGQTLEIVAASALFTQFPPIIYFGDGSNVAAGQQAIPSNTAVQFDPTLVTSMTWTGVDVRRETGPEANGQPSIHGFLADHLRTLYPDSLIINDDGAGELADVIVIESYAEYKVVRLYHCKSGHGAGADLDDLYEVIGQAQRSARWANGRSAFWKDFLRRLHTRKNLQFIQNPLDEATSRQDAEDWAEVSPLTRFEINVVQPFINFSASRPGDNVNVLLVSTHNAIAATGASFRLMCGNRDVR